MTEGILCISLEVMRSISIGRFHLPFYKPPAGRLPLIASLLPLLPSIRIPIPCLMMGTKDQIVDQVVDQAVGQVADQVVDQMMDQMVDQIMVPALFLRFSRIISGSLHI